VPGKNVEPQQKDLLTGRWRTTIRPRREDRALHIPLVSILRWALRPGVVMRHVPNGEGRDPKVGAKLKAMGVLPGSADLEFFWDSARTPVQPCLTVLFMELKIGDTQPSDAQQIFRQRMVEIGAGYSLVRSVDEALTILQSLGLLRDNVKIEQIGKRREI
jgi:hypothetical protein